MKFYDLDKLAEDFKKYGPDRAYDDNKYYITANIAAQARWLSEHKKPEKKLFANERYLSTALMEVEQGKIPAVRAD